MFLSWSVSSEWWPSPTVNFHPAYFQGWPDHAWGLPHSQRSQVSPLNVCVQETKHCNAFVFKKPSIAMLLCKKAYSRWVSNKWVREGAQIWKRPCTWNLKPFKQPETETEIEIWRGNQNLCHPIALATGLWFLLHISVLKRIKSFYRELSSVQLVGSFQILRVLGKYLTTLRTNTWSKTGQKFGQAPPPFWAMPERKHFCLS